MPTACRLSQTLGVPMPSPRCPNCSEQMSMFELGLDGVWSCIYCEGTWLSATEVQSILSQSRPAADTRRRPQTAATEAEAGLTCPTCGTRSFVAVAVGDEKAYCCSSCQGLFLRKGVLLSLGATTSLGSSGPEIAGKAFAASVGWLILSIFPFST